MKKSLVKLMLVFIIIISFFLSGSSLDENITLSKE